MALFNKIKQKAFGEFIDIIEWTDDTSDTMIWRFPRYNSEIKNGAQLTVRETQVAVLVNEGQFADVFQPGRHELTTSNMPILTTIRGWKYGFNSPFKVDVYFVNTKQFLNQRWGTANPIMMRDPEFGPIRLRAFGSYNFRVQEDPIPFIKNVAGTSGEFTTEGISEQLRNFVITKFTDYLGESKIAALDLAANMNEFSQELTIGLKDDFAEYGIELTRFLVENISLPEAVEEALDRRTSMGVIGNMTAYTQMQFADSLKDSANNPAGGGNLAGDAMGAGIGLAMAGQMAGQMMNPQAGQFHGGQQPPQQAAPTPPPMPQQTTYHVAVGGVQQGPFPVSQLQQMIQQEQLTRDTLVWTAGMPAWAAANSVQELSQLFGAVPPPL
ncbi:SPFH domain-containing protein [Macellibacteroides fermentans]|uniref:Membrane protease subunit (Stomatin/prohibitin family) n=1 Tax=Macellibacteroides fermentans TaxID=879969 RepID=A0A8E1ZVM4_9PORP|nr:SPFH domain-containing protein [Macellibacteroides fermentans]NYI49264.1 membrane protease subunit (stomatin/prohibitin family) [Macellibacteroides fermentans]